MTIEACAALVAAADSDRFLATMSARPDQRLRLWPLYAFNLEIARAPWASKEPMIAEMRLQWWRDVIEASQGDGVAPAHEVAGPLVLLIREQSLDARLLDEMVEARRWDIARDPFEDAADFSGHLNKTASHLMWLAASALGAPDRLEPQVRNMGWASGLANWFLAVPELEARGLRTMVDGRAEAVATLANNGLECLRAARSVNFGAATPAVRAGWQARAILSQAAAQPMRVANGSLGTSEFRRRASLVARSLTGHW